MENVIVPIFICVVLPVAIVAIIFAASINSDNKRAKVLIKAIEANGGINAEKLAESLHKPRKSAREILNLRLLRGLIMLLVGFVVIGWSVYLIYTDISEYGELFHKEILFWLGAGGCIWAVGISYLIVYFVTRKQIKD